MTTQNPLVHELKRLNGTIRRLEAEVSDTPSGDPLRVGDRLELDLLRQQRALLTDLVESDGDLGDLLEECRRRLRAAERKHTRIYENGQAHDLRHADEWWATEDQIDYLADLIRQLEAALKCFAPP